MKRLMPGNIGRGALRLASCLLPWFRLCGSLSSPSRLSATFSKALKWRWREIVNFLWSDVWDSLNFHPPTKSNMKSQFPKPLLLPCWAFLLLQVNPKSLLQRISFGSDLYLLVHCYIPPWIKFTLFAPQSWFIYAFEVQGNTFKNQSISVNL